MKIQSILSRIDAGVSIEIMSNPELLMQLLMDSTSLGVLKVRQVDDNTYVELKSVMNEILCRGNEIIMSWERDLMSWERDKYFFHMSPQCCRSSAVVMCFALSFFLSLSTGTIACNHYARECEF